MIAMPKCTLLCVAFSIMRGNAIGIECFTSFAHDFVFGGFCLFKTKYGMEGVREFIGQSGEKYWS